MSIAVIILAAGLGTRMKSNKPKVLHNLAGKSLLARVLLTGFKLEQQIYAIVHGCNQQDLLKNHINTELENSYNKDIVSLHWVEQTEQLGTGHAARVAIDTLLSNKISKQDSNPEELNQALILYGDVPLVNIKDLENLVQTTKKDDIGLLTINSANPYGLGRIIRDENNNIIAIVEERDCNAEQKLISEVNSGIFLLSIKKAKEWLSNLKNDNKQKEYYLTDIIKAAVSEGIKINSITSNDELSYSGVNTLYQLSQAERHYQFLSAVNLQESGVNIIDPRRIDIRGDLYGEPNITIDVNCVFEGEVKLASGCIIEPNCIIKNSVLGRDTHIKANSIIEESIIGDRCIIGPFARVRPDTLLDNQVQIGNFVEIKKSQVASGTKINHLSYVGDSIIGENVNIGAGTITCNFDGINKHQTIIGNNAFIGSNTSLVAPITIGENSTIGAGSTISKNAPDNKLTIARGKQTTIDNWHRKSETTAEKTKK